jgi:hypothetical protein
MVNGGNERQKMVGSTRKKLRGKRLGGSKRFEGDRSRRPTLWWYKKGSPLFFFQQRSNWAQDARPNVQSRACEWTMGFTSDRHKLGTHNSNSPRPRVRGTV